MNRSKEKGWVLIFLVLFTLGIGLSAYAVVTIDPFFHFHAPLTDRFFYQLNSERNQNDGITRHFEYTGMIIGTSETELFKASLAEKLFGGTFIKTPHFGGAYREMNDSIARALKRNPELKTVIRGLDIEYLLYDKDEMRYELSTFPFYLYDDDLLNDIRYVLNRSVLFDRICGMISARSKKNFKPGITTFDHYGYWFKGFSVGPEAVCPEGLTNPEAGDLDPMSEKTKTRIRAGFRQNITDLAEQYPDVTFNLFLTPYSLAWWRDMVAAGTAAKWADAEKVLTEEALRYPNIRLFSWNDRTDIIGNLNNYVDKTHYGPWICDQILQYIQEGAGLLTKENYESFFEREIELYRTFDYASMMESTVPAHGDGKR